MPTLFKYFKSQTFGIKHTEKKFCLDYYSDRMKNAFNFTWFSNSFFQKNITFIFSNFLSMFVLSTLFSELNIYKEKSIYQVEKPLYFLPFLFFSPLLLNPCTYLKLQHFSILNPLIIANFQLKVLGNFKHDLTSMILLSWIVLSFQFFFYVFAPI